MVYERDEASVRNAQESVKEAEDQLAIDAIEKQIKLLEKQQELINDQIDAYKDQQDALKELMESSNEYYENLISETEEYWDSLIDAIDNQKSKWDELVEQKEIAEAFALVQDALRKLGYTVDDVLNDAPGAFEAFRDEYLKALTGANSGNQDFLDGLAHATNSAKDAFSDISSSSEEMKDALGEIADATTPLATAADNIKAVGNAASTASSQMSGLKDACPSECVDNLNNANFDGLTKAFDGVKGKIEDISKALGGETDSVESAIKRLNDATVLDNLGIAFSELGKSISEVAGLLGVAGTGAQDATEDSSASMREGASEGGAGLAKAIEEIKNAADEFIGESADDEGETAIGRFNLLKSAIQTLVDEVIGNTEIEGTLIGSINSLPQISDEALNGDEGAIKMFNDFAESINACAEAASDLLAKIKEMEGLHLPSFGGEGESTSGEYTGTAKYNGDWRVGKNGKSLVGELGPELVLRNGEAITVGANGPEFVNLKKNDIVLNHLQSKAVLDKKNQVRALADGSVLSPISSAMSDTQAKLKGLVNGMLPTVGNIRDIVSDQTKEIQRTIENISKVSTNPNITITNPSFTVSGVTGEEVMRKIEGSFEGLMLNAYQKAMS